LSRSIDEQHLTDKRRTLPPSHTRNEKEFSFLPFFFSVILFSLVAGSPTPRRSLVDWLLLAATWRRGGAAFAVRRAGRRHVSAADDRRDRLAPAAERARRSRCAAPARDGGADVAAVALCARVSVFGSRSVPARHSLAIGRHADALQQLTLLRSSLDARRLAPEASAHWSASLGVLEALAQYQARQVDAAEQTFVRASEQCALFCDGALCELVALRREQRRADAALQEQHPKRLDRDQQNNQFARPAEATFISQSSSASHHAPGRQQAVADV
jgi:hypothetical protein